MSRRVPRAIVVVAVLAFGQLVPGVAHAGGPGVWTRVAVTGSSFNQVGMLRTKDGKLHLVYQKTLSNGNFAFNWSTISLAGQLQASGTALNNWDTLEGDPRLISDGSGGMRAVFKGGQNTSPSNFFARGPVYNVTSSNGSTWALPKETLGQHTVLNGSLAAVSEHDGTPVTSFGLNATLFFHEGTDPSAPASSPDGQVDGPQGTFALSEQSLAVDKDGSVWLAWYQSANTTKNQGYYVEKILPSQSKPMKAPSSGNVNRSNEPLFGEQVAFVARPGGGLYLAYCSPTNSLSCAHVDVWKVGSSTPRIVPDSGTHNAGFVALAAGLKGRVSVLWFDSGQRKIHAIRSNTTATAFGVDRTIPAPPGTFIFYKLQGEGTFGRLDIVTNILSTKSGNPIEFWHTQLLAGMRLTAKPNKFSHTTATTVTFTVTDAGQPVSGATVSCLGRSGKTSSNGVVKLTFAKGAATGKHVATARDPDYNPAKTTITVT